MAGPQLLQSAPVLAGGEALRDAPEHPGLPGTRAQAPSEENHAPIWEGRAPGPHYKTPSDQ